MTAQPGLWNLHSCSVPVPAYSKQVRSLPERPEIPAVPRDVLQTFLNNRLLEAIGPDDSRLERLRSAAADLAEKLREDPYKTLAWTVAALNPRASGSIPAFEEVGLSLASHWPTYGNLFPGTPVTIFRAMLLTALSAVIDEDERVAFAFALVSRNLLPHLELGVEARAIQPMVDAAEESARRAVATEWGLGTDGLENAEFEMPEIGGESAKIARPWLQGLIEGAVGPTNVKGEAAGKNPNPHLPNTPEVWTHEFAPRMTVAVAGAIDAGVDALRKKGEDAAKTFATAVQDYVQAVVERMAAKARATDRKVGLLWWRQALYSSELNVGYRTLPVPEAAVQMALDLHRQLPAFHPTSVEHFLRESIAEASTGSPRKKALVDLVKAIAHDEALRDRISSLPNRIDSDGPGLLLSHLVDAKAAGADALSVEAATGIIGDVQLTAADLAVIVFRELQACSALRLDPA